MRSRLVNVYVVLFVIFPLFLMALKLMACESDTVQPIPSRDVYDDYTVLEIEDDPPAPPAQETDVEASDDDADPEWPEVPEDLYGEEPPDEPFEDADGDGFSPALDCDDADVRTHPTAAEVCGDGVDQNCDGEDAACPVLDEEEPEEEIVDEPSAPSDPSEPSDPNPAVAVFYDVDLDGYSDLLDCDDEDPTVHPGAEDACGDARDQDCDGVDPECYFMPVPILTVKWQTPFMLDARRITLSGEYTFPDGSYGFTWRELATAEHVSEVVYQLPFVGPSDRFRFSVEYVDLFGETSWSCIGPYPPGTTQGRVAANVDGLPIEIETIGDPTGETTGCGLVLQIP